MDLSDLSKDERLALVALIKAIILADGKVSADEAEMLPDIIEEIGEDDYREAFALADQRFEDEAALKKFLGGIERQEARELVYGTILDLAMSDAIAGDEAPLLRWLASAWNVSATFDVPEGD